MCGIAGYSLSAASRVERTLAAQALLAGIAERGADAVGYACRAPGGPLEIHKQRSGASALLDQVAVPEDVTEALVHVRDYTKGHPRIEANNHPVRHGAVVGVHNGIIFNDDEVLASHGIGRAHPEMTVDSEVIFALAEESGSRARAFEELNGSMATAWMDERRPEVGFCARGVAHLAVELLLDEVLLALLDGPEAVGDMEAILHLVRVRGEEVELRSVCEPAADQGRRLPRSLALAEAARDQGAKLCVAAEAA